MVSADQMRFGAIVMAAVFGGPGVFYSIESFAHPSFAHTGFIYLCIALALLWAAQGKEPVPARRKLPPRKRR
jgi:hypothetical protein